MTAPQSMMMIDAITQRIDHCTREESEEPLVQAARRAIADPEHYGAAWPLGPNGWEVEVDILARPPDRLFWMTLNYVTATTCCLYPRGIHGSDGAPALIMRVMPPVGCIPLLRFVELVPLERAVAWALLEGEP